MQDLWIVAKVGLGTGFIHRRGLLRMFILSSLNQSAVSLELV